MKSALKNMVRNLKPLVPLSLWSFAKRSYYFITPQTQKVSSDYRILHNPDLMALKKKYEDTWKDSSIPVQQLKVNARSSKSAPVYEAAVKLLRQTGLVDSTLSSVSNGQTQSAATVLEIGCSTGYYADIFKEARLNVVYEGCDYSEAFVTKAKELHPDLTFKIEDATHLSYLDHSFDIGISGCCILHIIDYKKAIAETSRVASQYALFHRTPVLKDTSTTYAEKIGYGLPMFEIFFNESELFELFEQKGLKVIASEDVGSMNVQGLNEPVRITSYLCKKI